MAEEAEASRERTEDDAQEGTEHHHGTENIPQDLTTHSMGNLDKQDKDKQVDQHLQEKGHQFQMMFSKKLTQK